MAVICGHSHGLTTIVTTVVTITTAVTIVDDHRYYHRDAKTDFRVLQAAISICICKKSTYLQHYPRSLFVFFGSRVRLASRHKTAPTLNDYPFYMGLSRCLP